jgi:TctA family transporter
MLSWLTDIGGGIAQVFHLGVFIAALGGVTIGVVIGVIPGLGPAIAIALAIPLTYEMGAVVAIALMLGIYKGGTYGGSISAILINTPGTPAAAATVLDGYPLARQGKSGKALNVALAASVVGDFIGIMILCVIAQPMAAIALKFGPTELFALLVFAMTIIAGLSGQSLLKGLIAAVLGIAASTVGIDPLVGMPRFTFDRIFLDDGLPIIPMVIGLFAVTEVLRQAEQVADRSSGALLPPASTVRRCPHDAAGVPPVPAGDGAKQPDRHRHRCPAWNGIDHGGLPGLWSGTEPLTRAAGLRQGLRGGPGGSRVGQQRRGGRSTHPDADAGCPG